MFLTGILASSSSFIAVSVVGAIVVTSALYYFNLSAVSAGIYSVSVSRRTHAATVFVYAETFFQIAYAVAFFVYHHVGLLTARYALVVLILTVSKRADAVAVFVVNLTSRTRGRQRITADNCISAVSWKTLAYHGPDRAGVQDFAFGVDAAGFDLGTRIDALSVEARGLRRAFVIRLAFFFDSSASRLNIADVAWRTRAFHYVIVNVTVHSAGARILRARILATIVDAGPVRRTVRIASASQQHAGDPRIAAETGRTLADRLVIYTMTYRVLPAGGQGRRTRRHAVALDARVRTATLAVRSTSRNFRAGNIRISVVSQRARAYRFVIDDIANGTGSARAGIPAHRVDAGSLRRTVVVSGAFDLEDRLGGLAGTAAAADVSAGAHAHHGAYRVRRQDPTLGRFYARLYDRTRILTLVAETGEPARTVAVLPTLGPDLRLAVDVRVTGEAGRATAYRQMIENPAFRAGRARIVVHAGIDALHVDAGVIAGTVAVAVAADDAAAIQRTAVVALAATAIGRMVVREAFGVDARARTIRDQARIHAVVVHAGFVERALAVVPAFDRVARDVGITLVALLARADRFVISHVADGVGAAVARVATLPVDASFTIAAIVVGRTRPDDRQLYWSARTVDVGDPSLRTRANHGPYGHGIENVATSVLQARFDDRARIDAFLPDAHQFVRTVDVDSALRLFDLVRGTSLAVGEWISQRNVHGTAAGRHVILDVTNGVLRAG